MVDLGLVLLADKSHLLRQWAAPRRPIHSEARWPEQCGHPAGM